MKLKWFLLLALINDFIHAQYTLKDSLRGSLRPERDYNVLHYSLHVDISFKTKSISGKNIMTFKAMSSLKRIQLDLFENMKILWVTVDGEKLSFERKHQAVFVNGHFVEGKDYKMEIAFEGSPVAAKNPPWDGGFIWGKDNNNHPWLTVACQGDGASLWWPNKDHLSDEPEAGVDIYITAPSHLKSIANGNLISEKNNGKGTVTSHWKVSYPINNYNISIYVGKYSRFSDVYTGATGKELALDYYVLDYNFEKAKAHFGQVKKVLAAFEHYFGPYPFWNDGYALVETPYPGMEHQSAIAYGNNFQRGYLGKVTPEEFDFDYIIVHETGHEYFGNSVSCNDLAEMWLHEGFTTYMESLFVEYHYGKSAAQRYLNSQRAFIRNIKPIIGPFGVNYLGGDTDMYYKAAWMLHTLRNIINKDSVWFQCIREFYVKYEMSHTTTELFIDHIEQCSGKILAPLIHTYLLHAEIPVLEYMFRQTDGRTKIKFRLKAPSDDISMPITFMLDKKTISLEADSEWRNLEFNRPFQSVEIDTERLLVNAVKREWE